MSTDLAWAAGFIDGEGSIGCWYMAHKARGKRYKRLSLTVAQTALPPLEKLRELFGGYLTEVRPRGARKKTWQWCVRDAGVVDTWEKLKPYLMHKDEQFKEAIATYNTGPASLPL